VKTWIIRDSGGLWGSTDHATGVISAPPGNDYIATAIRVHELLHAWTSNPTKPKDHEEAFSWLEEARIDYLVSKLSQRCHAGITRHRQIDVDNWVKYGDLTQRSRAKAVLISRGYRMANILEGMPEDKRFIGNLLRELSHEPTYQTVVELAIEFDEQYPPEEDDLSNVNMGVE